MKIDTASLKLSERGAVAGVMSPRSCVTAAPAPMAGARRRLPVWARSLAAVTDNRLQTLAQDWSAQQSLLASMHLHPHEVITHVIPIFPQCFQSLYRCLACVLGHSFQSSDPILLVQPFNDKMSIGKIVHEIWELSIARVHL